LSYIHLQDAEPPLPSLAPQCGNDWQSLNTLGKILYKP
jgi:hypothetical protein